MSRNWRLYLDDLIHSCEKIIRFTEGMTQESFLADEKTFDAVIRNLEIVGVAVKKIPDEILVQMPEVEWKNVAGLRDIVAHEYFRIDPDIIWDVVQHKIPEVKEAVDRYLRL